jgi:hypothetical protein
MEMARAGPAKVPMANNAVSEKLRVKYVFMLHPYDIIAVVRLPVALSLCQEHFFGQGIPLIIHIYRL